MKITKTITIDLARAPDHPRILAVEGDAGSRAVEIRLKANLEPWPVPEEATVSLVYQKPDGTSGWYDTLPDGSSCCAIDGNVVTLELAPQVLTVEGTVSAALVLRDASGNQLTTFGFLIQVLSSPGDTESSRDYYNLKVVASIEELTARLDALEQQGGFAGANGKSAYELAQDAGFEGTVEAWLASLRGADGVPGADGQDGQDGSDGKSAYQYAVDGGYTGTEAEFAAKLAEEAPAKLSQLTNDLITGAEVGQTVRITAVDDNGVPTAWEAVDMEELFYIGTVITDAESYYFSFSQTEDGRQFELTGAVILITGNPETASTTYTSSVINGVRFGQNWGINSGTNVLYRLTKIADGVWEQHGQTFGRLSENGLQGHSVFINVVEPVTSIGYGATFNNAFGEGITMKFYGKGALK